MTILQLVGRGSLESLAAGPSRTIAPDEKIAGHVVFKAPEKADR